MLQDMASNGDSLCELAGEPPHVKDVPVTPIIQKPSEGSDATRAFCP